MMGDGRDAGLADEFRECQTERDIQRYRQGILNQQHVQIKSFPELVQVILEMLGKVVNLARKRPCTRSVLECGIVDLFDGRMRKMRLGNNIAESWDRDRKAPRSRSTDDPAAPARRTTSRLQVRRRPWMPAAWTRRLRGRLLAGIG